MNKPAYYNDVGYNSLPDGLERNRKMENRGIYWLSLAFLTLFSIIFASIFISTAIEDEKRSELFAMHERSDSIIWAIEGMARYMGRRNGASFSAMMAEIGRQPGIAWIAVVNDKGRIIGDSNAQLEGSLLYTPGELAALNAGSAIKGRFSPDDPDIYETWKLFRPGRLRGHMHHAASEREPALIFVALDATEFNKAINHYRTRLIIESILSTLILLFGLTLVFFAWNYRNSRRRLRDIQEFSIQILKNYPYPLIVTDEKGNVILFNDHAKQMFGQKIIPATLDDLPCLDWEGMLAETGNGGRIVEEEKNIMLPDGGQVPVSLTVGSIPLGRDALGHIFSFRNLAEIRRLEEQLSTSRKLSAIGKLASGLAHEIRNPLSSICGYAHYLEQKFGQGCMEKEIARLLVEETTRINNVLTDLLRLARPPRLNMQKMSVQNLLQKVYMLALPDAREKGINLEMDKTSQDIPEVMADADKLTQALLNLVINAHQATPKDGSVCLAAKVILQHDVPYIQIRVRDTGHGISDKNLQQIFTPYFSTRATGTGLGLAITRQIVESHGGSLIAASVPGQGATMTIILPVDSNGSKDGGTADCIDRG